MFRHTSSPQTHAAAEEINLSVGTIFSDDPWNFCLFFKFLVLKIIKRALLPLLFFFELLQCTNIIMWGLFEI